MAEHTPTPWICDSEGILPTSRDGVSIVARIPNHPDNKANWNADAAFICKAVNNHEALVAMLEEARLQIEYMQSKFEPTGTGNAVLARIRATLSDVGGTPK